MKTAVPVSHDAMTVEIRHQRMIEFARENQRFHDLKRWASYNKRLPTVTKSASNISSPVSMTTIPSLNPKSI
jgi:hypothetical protein